MCYVHDRDEDGHVVRFVATPRLYRWCFCCRRVSLPRAHVYKKKEVAERKAVSPENRKRKQQQRQRKRTTSKYAVRQKGRSPEAVTSIRICVLPWISWGLQDLSPGMSPIAVRHFEHGSEASTLFTCALVCVYMYTVHMYTQQPENNKTLCARVGPLAHTALSSRSGNNPLPLRICGALLCSTESQAPSPFQASLLMAEVAANAKQGSTGNTRVTVSGHYGSMITGMSKRTVSTCTTFSDAPYILHLDGLTQDTRIFSSFLHPDSTVHRSVHNTKLSRLKQKC